MSAERVLDTVEKLVRAAGHPDITDVYRYDDRGTKAVGIVFGSLAKAWIWPSSERRKPADLPADLGSYEPRTNHMLKLLVDLFEIAQPSGWAWRTVSVEGVHLAPCGIEVDTGGDVVLLRVTAGGALKDKDTEPARFADWTIPADTVRDAV